MSQYPRSRVSLDANVQLVFDSIVNQIPDEPDIVLGGLFPSQIKSVALLAAGEPAKEVAAKVGVTLGTLRLWMNHDEDFRHALWRAVRTHLFLRDLRREISEAGTDGDSDGQ